MKTLLTKCPHCGDDRAGYYYSCLAFDRRGGPWGEPSESSNVELIKDYPKTVRCGVCGKRVPREDAEDAS